MQNVTPKSELLLDGMNASSLQSRLTTLKRKFSLIFQTFCVVSRRFQKHFVQRFSATRSLCVFAPWNRVRRAGVYLCSNQYFDYVVMLTIGVNCIFLAMTKPIEEAE